MNKILYGCDPEIFAVSKYVPEAYADHLPDVPFVEIPAYISDYTGITEIPGGDFKHPIYLESSDYRIVGDGAAYEINLKRPCDTPMQMREIILTASHDLKERLSKNGMFLWEKPVVNFDFKRWWTRENMANPRYEMSMIFGCDPDIDAFAFQCPPATEDVSEHPYRYGGGHLHFSGYSFSEYMDSAPLPFVKLMAIFVGNYWTLVSPFSELDKVRATRYGKPGKYRRQVYKDGTVGLEYRTPSNSWMSLPETEYLGIFNLASVVADIIRKPGDARSIIKKYSSETVEAITSANKELSKQILSSLGAI